MQRLASWFKAKFPKVLTNPQVANDVQRCYSLLVKDSSLLEQDLSSTEKLHYCQKIINDQITSMFSNLGNYRFQLSVDQSSIQHPSAGNGVFVSREKIDAGDVVAIYPGQVVLPLDFSRIIRNPNGKTFMRLFGTKEDPNVHKIQRFDKIFIDGSVCLDLDHSFNYSMEDPDTIDCIKRIRAACLKNPFAVGHLINHPPKNTAPNVVICPFNFPSEGHESLRFPQELRPLVPNGYFRDNQPGYIDNTGMQQSLFRSDYKEILVPSLVFIATREINRGEELFVDYRFNPKYVTSEWFHPVDIEESTRRWS